jgi:hypothetical protein
MEYVDIQKQKLHVMDTDYFLVCMSFYYRDDDWNDDESDSDFNNMHEHEEYSHSEIIHRCNFGSKHLINARLSSEMSYQADSYSHDAAPQCLNSNNIKSDHGTEDTIKTFPTTLKLISGTLVGGVKYSDIYINSNEDEDLSSTNDYVNNNDKGQDKLNIKYQHYHK